MFKQIITELNTYANPQKAALLGRFFKTGQGQYGEGDKFIGIMVPYQRIVAKKYIKADLSTIEQLLKSTIHEHRLTGLLILTYQFPKLTDNKQRQIVKFYLDNTQYINNWDLVDLSSPRILGQYLIDKDRSILYQLAKSNNLWEKRIAIISTCMFIRLNQFQDTINISKILIRDHHDLIHKAVGWMLREMGKKDQQQLEQFLNRYYKTMPRTMLRYAIEKLSEEKRIKYLAK